MTADTWRRSEAESRQEMDVHTCAGCGDSVDDCDAFECEVCGEHFCLACIADKTRPICGECLEAEDAFNEVSEVAEFKSQQLEDDTLTGEEWTK